MKLVNKEALIDMMWLYQYNAALSVALLLSKGIIWIHKKKQTSMLVLYKVDLWLN